MPWSPKPRCRICRQLHCQNPDHQKKPRERGDRVLARPDYNSTAQVKRRRRAVDLFLLDNAVPTDDGRLVAVCPQCGSWRSKFVADHVVPIAEGGTEDGALQVHCSVCSGRQGAMLAARRKRKLI